MIIKSPAPWLTTRKRLIGLVFIDLLIFIISNAINLVYLFTFKNIFYYFIWIISSYFVGRYHILLQKDIFYKKYIIKTFLSLFLLIIFYKIAGIFFINSIGTKFIILNIICSTLLILPLRKIVINLIKNNTKWLFIGKNDTLMRLKNYEDISQRDYAFKMLHKDLILSQEKIDENFKVILYDFNELNQSEIIKLKYLGYEVISLFDWCKKYLERYPIDIISKKFKKINTPESYIYNYLKRFADIFLSILILLFISPVFLIICILIILEDGKGPFYTQVRTGYKSSKFKIIKLRTMIKNAEKEGAVWSRSNDERITKVGKFVRRSRIDEIPQLISVIKGDMSLIGPRPERPEIDKMLSEKIKNYNLRYQTKPGLSGWAQVNYPYGASIKDSEYKLSYDMYYQENKTILLDLLVLLKTIKMILNLEGAIAKN